MDDIPVLAAARQLPLMVRFACKRCVHTVFDVGANRGGYTRKFMHLYKKADIYAFEPAPWNTTVLNEADWRESRVRVVPTALADYEGTATLHRFSKDGLESLAPATDEYVQFARFTEVESVEVPVTTLNAFCADRGIRNVGLMKLDVQGSDLAVLRGASNLLNGKKITALFVELMFYPYYEGQCWGDEIIEYLGGFGYRLKFLVGPDRKYDLLAHANGLFV